MASQAPWLSSYKKENYPAAGRLFGDFLCGLWETACDALRVPVEKAGSTARTLRSSLPAWKSELIGTAPARPSYVADDGFLAEISVNWHGPHPELRLLFDCLGECDDLISPGESGAPRARIVARRFEQIHEIFGPRAGRASSAPLWHSVAWRPPSRVVHKTYFGLYEWPPSQRYAAVDEAMGRLGMAAAWTDARRRIEDAPGRREIEFFAVDQADEADARVKIYYRSHGADLVEMNRIAAVALSHDGERALAAYRILAGDRTDAGEGALTCLAFRTGLNQAAEATTYLRLADLAPDDRQAVDRTVALLRAEGVDTRSLPALAGALTPTPLEESRGFLALVSYRAAGRRGDVTTYFRFPVYTFSS